MWRLLLRGPGLLVGGGRLAQRWVADLSWDAQRQDGHSPSPLGWTFNQPSDPEARGGEGNPLPLQLGVEDREHMHFALGYASLRLDWT